MKASAWGRPCIALIADMVKSRDVTSAQRPRLQQKFTGLVDSLNEKYSRELLSKFVITLGDEFQGLLRHSSEIPDIIWDIEEGFSERQIRLGFGYGILHTPAPKFAINVDGPALHNARSAIQRAKKDGILGGVFMGFPDLDQVLNGVARILWFHRSRWTEQQRRIAALMRKGLSQSEVAEKLEVSRQAVSKHVSSAGWVPYSEAEQAFRTILKQYVDPLLGAK